MDFEQLADRVGDTFEFSGVPLTLTSATPVGAGGSLVFAGPLEQPLEQATHAVTHPGLGDGAVFIVPIGAGADTRTYEAIFG